MSTSRIIGILGFVVTALTLGASLVGQLKPQYAVYMLAIAGAISAFTGRIQGTPPK